MSPYYSNSVTEWKGREDEFCHKSVFVDESGFNLHLRRLKGWAKAGVVPKTTIPTNRGSNISVIGVICHLGILSMSVRVPKASKKRKVTKLDRWTWEVAPLCQFS